MGLTHPHVRAVRVRHGLLQLAGGVLAWSLHRSAAQGEVPYQPVSSGAGGAAGNGAGGSAGAYGRMPASDPFAAYQPPQVRRNVKPYGAVHACKRGVEPIAGGLQGWRERFN